MRGELWEDRHLLGTNWAKLAFSGCLLCCILLVVGCGLLDRGRLVLMYLWKRTCHCKQGNDQCPFLSKWTTWSLTFSVTFPVPIPAEVIRLVSVQKSQRAPQLSVLLSIVGVWPAGCGHQGAWWGILTVVIIFSLPGLYFPQQSPRYLEDSSNIFSANLSQPFWDSYLFLCVQKKACAFYSTNQMIL